MNHEVVIYIHGISPDEGLATIAKVREGQDLSDIHDPRRKSDMSHEKDFKALRLGISRFIRGEDRQKAWDQANHCYTEWGWEYQESDAQNLGASHRLADAQKELGQRVIQAIGDSYRVTLIPLMWFRRLALYGLSDVFYCVSSDGQHSIRARLYDQIANRLSSLLDDANAQISLTLIGHSAGSVIALDLMSYLFTDDDLFMGGLKEQARGLDKEISVAKKEREQHGGGHQKSHAVSEDTRAVVENLIRLKSIKDDKRLTLRRLITMGSPIAMLALRSDQSIRELAYGDPVSLASIGLPGTREGLDGPYWANI